jgi:hypothetical protein
VVRPDGLQLRHGTEVIARCPRSGGTRYAGGNRLLVPLEGGPVELAVSRWGLSQPRLARDLVAFLNGERATLRPGPYLFGSALLVALLPLGIPLLALGLDETTGTLWAGVGLALVALCWIILRQERWSLSLRRRLALALGVLGYIVPLAQILGGEMGPAAATPRGLKAPRGSLLTPGGGRLRKGGGMLASLPLLPPGERVHPRPSPRPLLGAGPTSGADLQPAGHIGSVLDMVFAPSRGCALAATPDGSLRVYSYPDFRLRSVCPLEQVIYRAALDVPRGLLYAAVCPPANLVLGPLGNREQARGDLQVFDVRELLTRAGSDARPAAQRLTPLRTLNLDADVSSLWLSPDGDSLHYLGTERRSTHIGRVRTADLVREATRPLRFTNGALYRSANGRMLYGAALDHLFTVDPQTLSISRSVSYPGGTIAIAGDDSGRLFLVEAGRFATITVLDMHQSQVVGNWSLPLRGRIYLALAPDGRRLYVSNALLTGNRIYSLLIGGERGVRPQLLGQAASDRGGVVRGENFVSPDGKFLVNRAGRVFRLSPPPADEG